MEAKRDRLTYVFSRSVTDLFGGFGTIPGYTRFVPLSAFLFVMVQILLTSSSIIFSYYGAWLPD